MIHYKIYLIDDEESIRHGIGINLKRDYDIQTFANAETALSQIERAMPDLVLLDIGLPGMNGIDALKRIKSINPNILVVIITGFEDIDTVITSMKFGAYDYIVKPIQISALRHCITNALDTIRLQKEVQELQGKAIRENMPCIVGESNAIQDVMLFIRKVASSPVTPVLITGESGTGKELIAAAIHYQSPNFKGPFVTLNCAAIPGELIESELFGYEKGAFSGANVTGKKGLLEIANDGTLFLDEIGDLSLAAQSKLLRWLENGKFYKVGGTVEQQSTVRIVSATNKNLESLVDSEGFRLDLFYRIGVIKVQIPSLKDRKEDIIPIAEYFLAEFSNRFNKPFISLSKEAQSALRHHPWKGNIRELKNLIERGVIIGTPPVIHSEDLGFSANKITPSRNAPMDLGQGFPSLPKNGIDLESLEKHLIKEALRQAEGNDTKAAELLGLSYYAFRYRRKKYESTTDL
ncbi:sigma-54 dependent transcriptional regulator [bacterium]|nr:sigma-54 dependent transcriptional regulator [bacterium]